LDGCGPGCSQITRSSDTLTACRDDPDALREFPRGVLTDDADLALAHAMQDVVHGRLDERPRAWKLPSNRSTPCHRTAKYRLKVAIASLKLELATRRGHFANVIEQVNLCQPPPLKPQSNEDVALGSDLPRIRGCWFRGIVETWTLRLADAEATSAGGSCSRSRDRSGVPRGKLPGTPRLRVKAAWICPGSSALRRSDRLRGRHGWGNDRSSPQQWRRLGGTLIWTGEFAVAERWLERAARVGPRGSGAGNQAACAPRQRACCTRAVPSSVLRCKNSAPPNRCNRR